MMITPPLKGGEDFVGNTGRKTANACAIDAIETNVISAAHFMSRGLNRLPSRSKENFRVIAVIRRKRE
ncbi:MAG: hypothetical protein DMF26_03910 [Verrucomicrobia bacterium]|nr:MAG: hypothetical protein DMF26_03910 [Verrucomicrobiota bacterium]